jgi:hypothetical protein
MLPLSLSDRNPFELVTTSSSGALADGRLSLERSEVHRHSAERFGGRPGPLINRFDDHERVAERLVVLSAHRNKLEGVRLRQSIGPDHHAMVTDLTLGIHLPKLRIPGG